MKMWLLENSYLISLITGWTFYTEKYKAQGPDRPQEGLYGGPRDLYFSYGQSNQLLRSLLPDWNIQNWTCLGKFLLNINWWKTLLKCNNLPFQVFPESFRKFTDNFPNVTNISRPLSIVSLPFSQKSCVLTLIESRINGLNRLYGNV